MGELRTVGMVLSAIGVTKKDSEHLFDKAARIKKIQLCVTGKGNVASDLTVHLTKHNVAFAHDGVGHLAMIRLTQNFLTSGMASGTELLVIDYGNDYIEIPDEGVLYLTGYSQNAGFVGNAWAVIYYEE